MREVVDRHTRRLLDHLRRVRELYGAERFDEIDQLQGRSPGHLSRILRRARRPASGRRGSLSVQDLFGYLETMAVAPQDFFAGAFGPPTNLHRLLLAELESATPAEVRKLKATLRRSPAGKPPTPEEIRELEQLRFSDLAAAETRTFDALAALRAIDADRETAERLAEVWGVLASVSRTRARFSAAAHCLRQGLEVAGEWGLDGARAGLLQRACYLAGDQNEYQAAVAIAHEAMAVYVLRHDLPGVGKTLVDSAVMFRLMGELGAAIQAYQSSLHYLPEESLLNRFAVCQGLGNCFLVCGELQQAERCLSDALAALDSLPAGPSRMRASAQWLRAEIAIEKGDFESAECDLRAVLAIYLSNGNIFDLATCSLRLSKVLFLLGKTSDLRELAFQMDSLIKPLQRKHEFLAAALMQFIRAAFAGELTSGLIDRIYLQFKGRGALSAEAPRL